MSKKSIWFRIKRRINQKIIAPYIRQISGIEELENNIYYFLNHSIDITKCKPANGLLRQKQLADFELLKLFDKFCETNGLTYWLTVGTLLGAVRHKGWIPWDDDVDVAMPREDFTKAIKLLPKYFKDTGYWFSNEEESISARGFIGRQGGVNIDIFAMDCATCENEEELIQKFLSYKKELKLYGKPKNEEDRCQFYLKIFGNQNHGKKFWHRAMELDGNKFQVFEDSNIWPLSKTKFEGAEFFAPNDIDKYLIRIFGNYMEFPRNRLLHHHGLMGEAYKNENNYFQTIEEMKKDNEIILQRLAKENNENNKVLKGEL